ncbi:MarR family winged helix-turn-helix transcriptional regulator [Rhizobium halophytocola]|uniref:DNA-binding MarR family transcriptional regulator n=1 Tax=Rhizobium halophytocola TaxID=735519 RepID=A0ABS4E3J6_9HYPH|nr:MarR family transcriptional regulator [Rhizobium halophytocola]MBP1852502.1 DNA-binding MarR family transcriptional regulator [Rhizobium halophytocola]
MLDIYEMPAHLIRRLNQASVSLFMENTTSRGYDLTPVQYGALIAIGDRPGLDQATLASNLAHDRVTIGGVIDRLVLKNFVRREVSPTDRRARELFLTAEGLAIIEKVRPIMHELQDLLLQGLDASERTMFVQMLQKATDAVNDRSRAPLRFT